MRGHAAGLTADETDEVGLVDHQQIGKLQMDILAMAFACDLTRVGFPSLAEVQANSDSRLNLLLFLPMFWDQVLEARDFPRWTDRWR